MAWTSGHVGEADSGLLWFCRADMVVVGNADLLPLSAVGIAVTRLDVLFYIVDASGLPVQQNKV